MKRSAAASCRYGLSVALIALLASGCASMNRHEQVGFESAKKNIKLSARAGAQPTTLSREQLVKDDHFEVGRLTVSLTVEECPGTVRGTNCKAITHKEAPTQRLLREAAVRGGDLVHFDRQDQREEKTGSRQGRCLAGRTVMQYVSVPVYRTECRYTSGGIQFCEQRQSGSRMEPQPVYQCTLWEQTPYAYTVVTSAGIIWRHDPIHAQDDRLRLALERGTRRQVAALVPDRETANRRLLNGELPVNVAVQADNTDAIAALLDRGVDVGQSTVVDALRSLRSLRVLLARGADVNAADGTGRTALMKVAEAGAEEFVDLARLLIERGANVNAADQWGNTALMMAAGGGRESHVDIVRLLLRHRADANALDNTSSTALMDAARGGTKAHVETVKLLLKHGADRALRDMHGKNAYDHISRDVSKELQDELARLLGGSAALTRTPVQKLDEAPVRHGQRFDVAVEVPPPWTQATGDGRTVVEMAGDPNVSGALRVLILEPEFGYDPKVHRDHWSYLADAMRITGAAIPLQPFTGLTLPPGWEARVTALPFDPGRSLWVARRQGDFVLLYTFVFIQPLAARDGNGQLDFKLAAAQNPLFNKHKAELEHMVAHTRFTPRP